ncbi:MAG: RNA polymerase sigma factor [Bacteroidales bacterium]|nr:RNA polymerase sigma factor [Bacteroidales bacterium]
MEQNEAKLVEACRRRDEEACRTLYDRFAPKMLGICMRYTGSRDEAQDVLHEGFIRVFSSLGQLRNTDSLASWMSRIMTRTALNYIRYRKHFESIEAAEFVEAAPDTSLDLYDTEQLVKAIQALPDNYRAIFNLVEVEGYSYEELALQLGLQQSSVRSLLSRAKHRLAQNLAELR